MNCESRLNEPWMIDGWSLASIYYTIDLWTSGDPVAIPKFQNNWPSTVAL